MIILLFSVLFGVLVVFRFVAQDSGEFSATLVLTGNEAPKDHESKAPDLCQGFRLARPKNRNFPLKFGPDSLGPFFWPRTFGDYYVKTVKKIVFYVLSIVRPC